MRRVLNGCCTAHFVQWANNARYNGSRFVRVSPLQYWLEEATYQYNVLTDENSSIRWEIGTFT